MATSTLSLKYQTSLYLAANRSAGVTRCVLITYTFMDTVPSITEGHVTVPSIAHHNRATLNIIRRNHLIAFISTSNTNHSPPTNLTPCKLALAESTLYIRKALFHKCILQIYIDCTSGCLWIILTVLTTLFLLNMHNILTGRTHATSLNVAMRHQSTSKQFLSSK